MSWTVKDILSVRKGNEEMRKGIRITPITELMEQYERNWKEHGERMSSDKSPKEILKYQPERM
jgi:hypothetical protein